MSTEQSIQIGYSSSPDLPTLLLLNKLVANMGGKIIGQVHDSFIIEIADTKIEALLLAMRDELKWPE